MENQSNQPIKKKKKIIIRKTKTPKLNFHIIFFIAAALLFVYAIVRLLIWNKGEDSGYDPNAEITTEFDVETMDHIQPMDISRFEGITDDGVTTLLCLGNSPFSDNKGEDGLAQTLAKRMNGVAYDASFPESYQSMYNKTYQKTYRPDGISLYPVVSAICSGDYTQLSEAASTFSEEAAATVEMLKNIDYTTIDMLVIMYDLSDYTFGRPLYNPNDDNDVATWTGSLNASLELIEATYPHIRTIVISPPACGKTIDGFFVDGTKFDLGNGTLADYINYEMNVILANGVSFIDLYYGVITPDNRDEYLIDGYRLNDKAVNAIADRFYHFFGDAQE